MAASTSASVPLKNPRDPDSNLPMSEGALLTKTPKGWIASWVKVRGMQVLEKAPLTEAVPKLQALEALKIAIAKRLILGAG
jgi:hypothetical protein